MRAAPPPSASRPGLPCSPDAVDDFISQPTPRVVEVLARSRGPFLILGAGGKIGLHLSVMLRRALDQLGRKDRVVAVSRFSTLRDRAAFESRGVETLACDLGRAEDLKTLPEAPTIFFLAGVKFGTAAAPGLLRATNVEIPQRVAEKYSHARIIAYSSGCVYPFVTPASGGAREDTPPSPVGDYAASCIAREQAFTEVAAAQGTPVALIRLNYSIEFRYGLLVDIAQMVLAGRPVDVTTGYVNVIWQTDAVAHSIQALEIAGSPAVPINVTGAETLSVRDLALRFAAALGRSVEITGIEAETAWLNNASHSHRLFGPPLTTVDQMITWISAWLLQNGETWGKPTGFERRDGRF
ncbi:MAG: NAD(P)-dependent oxidoreductase [Opitutaceae bacterium]|nr:NAD(P)-dependent oxidoreductase [Opitutaceae bacterium]